MKRNAITLAKILTYSGTLPLVGAALNQYLAVIPLDNLVIARTYAAIIIAFLNGIHWAVFLFFSDKCPRNLFITSNITALLAWLALLLPHPSYSLGLLVWSFLYLLVLDWRIAHAGIYPVWFYDLRRNATVIVVLCLVAMMGGL